MQSEDGGDLSSFVRNPEWEVLGKDKQGKKGYRRF